MSITSDVSASAAATDYCPDALTRDAARLGLQTSLIDTALGPVAVRHGRRTTTGAPATILLHGAAGSWTTWTPLISAADRQTGAGLADLIIPDLPGWGDTPLPRNVDAETIESLAAAVAEIATALGYPSWQVFGHSLGGFVALELAASTPRQTSFVGLVSATTFSVITSVRHPLTRFAVLPGFTALLGVMRVLAALGPVGRGVAAGLHRVGLLRPLVSPLFGDIRRVDGSVVAALAAEARPRSFALAARRAGRYDAEVSWARIECPVRSVHGDRDVFVTADDDRRMADVIADLEVTVLGRTGHFGHVERPSGALRALHSPGTLALPRQAEES
ncbi:alpha/beta hydrolase [Cryobacterium lactosi]|uniref:Alpha/beta hydrolase n=1 Tax=Cryobacterium lactosi TaxID=1259202 RepID=A0A4V3IX94_9MICO|nr:alpha/beta hydrolase [Cryobacterium lactosi]TFD89403.1 alpha/beta hydrolase [Cryobacterium lactosi]